MLISLMLPNAAYAFMDMYYDPAVERTKEQQELENIQQFFYESPISKFEVKNQDDKFDTGISELYGPITKDLKGMPLFKQLRIKISNHYRIKAHEEMLEEKRLQEAYLKQLEEELDDETTLEELQEENLQNLLDTASKSQTSEKKEKKKFNFFKKDKGDETPEIEIKEKKDNPPDETAVEDSDVTKIEGGVKQIEAEKDVILDCDVVNYLEETGEVEALGRPTISFPPQDVKITADRITYNVENNILKAFDNVEVNKDGNTMYGDFLQINMNEENALITNLKSEQMNMTVYAKTANASDDLVVLEKGSIKSEHPYVLRLQTQFMRVRIDKMVIPEAAQSHFDDLIGHTKVKVVAKDIKINAKEEHDVVTVKDGTVQLGDSKLFNFRSFTVHTNKNHGYVETNIPEFGSRSQIGMFAGPGFAFDTPFASTVKLIPFINYKDDIGVGGALRYTSGTKRTDMMYGSAKDVFVLRGRQYLDDKLFLQYGVNSYINDWWMGHRMAKYLAELVYSDRVTLRDFWGEGRPLNFSHRITAGYMQDGDVNKFDSAIKSSELGTMRFKYMAQIMQSLYSYHNRDKRLHLDAGLALQGSAALYGTGDTQFVGRIGPYLHTQYKYWMQDIAYFQSGYSDESPIPRFDAYRYGRSNVSIREALRVNKYLTLAYATSINLSGDSPNHKDIQENAFIIALGPDDFKVSFGYDFMREQTYFTIAMALDTKGSSVEYDRMEIRHPDRLGQDKKKYVKPVVFPEDIPQRPVKRTYAEVITIEDPNKEQI